MDCESQIPTKIGTMNTVYTSGCITSFLRKSRIPDLKSYFQIFLLELNGTNNIGRIIRIIEIVLMISALLTGRQISSLILN